VSAPESETPVIEAEVVNEAVEPDAPGAEIVTRPTHEVLMPMDTEQVVEGMKAYQQLLPQLLDQGDYQEARDGRFVKKSGWRKIARAFNLSVTIVRIEVGRDEEGRPVRAECVARAIAPNGQMQDADGYCTISEFTGKRLNDVKLENTLRATATTRAKNRAIADLVGMGEVSAEEMGSAGDDSTTGPPYGPQVSDEQRKAASADLIYLCGPEAREVWGQIKTVAGGYMPAVVAEAIHVIATANHGDVDTTVAREAPPDTEGLPDAQH